MANEITMQITFSVTNGNFVDTFDSTLRNVDQAMAGRGGYAQDIGTTEEVIDLGDVSTNGYCILTNLDAANYVEWGPESAGAMVTMGKLKSGEYAIFRMAPGVVLRAKANTSNVLLDVRLYED